MYKTISNSLLIFALLVVFGFSATTTHPYKTVRIGQDTWMAENLIEISFQNGEPITQAHSKEEWEKLGIDQKPAWCYYNFDSSNGKRYGLLYNFYAVNDARGLAPTGWHVATMDEWQSLYKAVGNNEEGTSLKAKQGWIKDGNGTNASGFNALPGGTLNIDAGEYGYWWTATKNKDYIEGSYIFFLGYDMTYLDSRTYSWNAALSVRCVKDTTNN